MKQRIDERAVKALQPPAKGARILWDKDLSGFGVKVTAKGAKSYILNYRIDGRERRYKIGDASSWTATAARKYAADLKAGIRRGDDPLAQLEERRTAPTMADLCDRFEADHLPRLRPASRKMYLAAINGSKTRKGIRRTLGSKKVADLRHADLDALHRSISATAPTMANRTQAVVSKMLSQAVRLGWRDDNPARGIERNQEIKRDRHLSPKEIGALTVALAELPDQQAADVFRLMLFTGCRKSEALSMRWDQIDFDRAIWTKPAATTKQKKDHRVPLSGPALQLLGGIDRRGPWVFAGKIAGEHRVEVKAQWENVCRAAGLVDDDGQKTVRMHDLRHTYASVLASAGLSLPVIGQLLGHTQPATTARYAHFLDDPLRRATEQAAAAISGKPPADVIDLRDRQKS